jgi:predicted nucleic acid-binding protein
VRVILDTGVFFRPEALRRAAAMEAELVVPTVVFMERARQLRRDGGDVAAFAKRLAADGYVVEPFRASHALRFAVPLTDDQLWRKHFRDAMIAGHLEEGDELWTTNRRDFERIGVPREQIVDAP